MRKKLPLGLENQCLTRLDSRKMWSRRLHGRLLTTEIILPLEIIREAEGRQEFLCSVQEASRIITFLASRVNRNINYISRILTSRAINWYINESILRGSKGGGVHGGLGN